MLKKKRQITKNNSIDQTMRSLFSYTSSYPHSQFQFMRSYSLKIEAEAFTKTFDNILLTTAPSTLPNEYTRIGDL